MRGRVQGSNDSEPVDPVRGLGTTVRSRVALGLILLLALLLRLGAVLAIEPTPLVGDEIDYYRRGVRLSEGGRLGEGFRGIGARMPGTEIVYASVFLCLGADVSAARLCNVSLSVLTILPVFFLGSRLGGTLCGLTAAALLAGYPNFIAYSHYLWSETLYTLLAVSSLAILVEYAERAVVWKLLLAAVAMALASLTRAVGVPFALVVACWLAWTQRADWKRALSSAAVFGLVFSALLAPWLVYVNRHSDRPVLVVKQPAGFDYFVPDSTDERPLTGASTSAWRAIGRASRHSLGKVAYHLPGFFTPNSFAVVRLLAPEGNRWAYRFSWKFLERPWIRIAAVVVTVGVYVVMAVLGVGGLILAPRRDLATLYALFPFSQLFTTLFFFAMSRFRLPSMAVLIVGTALLLVGGREVWRKASPRRRWTSVAAMILLLGMIATRLPTVIGPHWP